MLLENTIKAVDAILRTDPAASPKLRRQFLAILRDGIREPDPPNDSSESRLLRRAEAARRLSCSLRTLDKLASSGILQKRKLPGRIRAMGIAEEDLHGLITGMVPQ